MRGPTVAEGAVEADRAVAEMEAALAELDAGQGIGEAEAEALFDELER